MRIILRQSAPHVMLCTVSGLPEKSEVCALTNVACFSASGDRIYEVEMNREAKCNGDHTTFSS